MIVIVVFALFCFGDAGSASDFLASFANKIGASDHASNVESFPNESFEKAAHLTRSITLPFANELDQVPRRLKSEARIAWRLGSVGQSCNQVCGVDGCSEDSWPRTEAEFNAILGEAGLSCNGQVVDVDYGSSAPSRWCSSSSTCYCFYAYVYPPSRCAATRYETSRYCPCKQGTTTAAPTTAAPTTVAPTTAAPTTAAPTTAASTTAAGTRAATGWSSSASWVDNKYHSNEYHSNEYHSNEFTASSAMDSDIATHAAFLGTTGFMVMDLANPTCVTGLRMRGDGDKADAHTVQLYSSSVKTGPWWPLRSGIVFTTSITWQEFRFKASARYFMIEWQNNNGYPYGTRIVDVQLHLDDDIQCQAPTCTSFQCPPWPPSVPKPNPGNITCDIIGCSCSECCSGPC